MATNDTVSSFEATYSGAAITAGQALGVSPALVLSQWALESGYGTSTAAQAGNLAGIQTGGVNRTYPDLGSFVTDYVNTIKNYFPQAVGTGNNADAFVGALGNGTLGSYFGSQSAASYEAGVLGAAGTLATNLPAGSPSNLGDVYSSSQARGAYLGNPSGTSSGGAYSPGGTTALTAPSGTGTGSPASQCGGGVTGLGGVFTWACWQAIALDAGMIVLGLGFIVIGVVGGVRGSPVTVITGGRP